MKKVVFACVLALPLILAGCAQSGAFDSLYDQSYEAQGGIWNGAEAPAGLVTANWAAPYEVDAEDITLADVPRLTLGITDTPFNTAPPPFGTMYYPWKLFVAVVRAFPFVTYATDGESNGMVTFADASHPGPLWYVVGPALEELDSWVIPVRETQGNHHTPVPGNGNLARYWRSRSRSTTAHFSHIGNMLKYYFLNANSDQPPYDNFFPDTLQRDKTTIHQAIDNWVFLYDWDDPYVN